MTSDGFSQGKSEQMMDYIKKLRACVRQFQDLETSLTFDKEELRRQLDEEKDSREHSGMPHSLLFVESPSYISTGPTAES